MTVDRFVECGGWPHQGLSIIDLDVLANQPMRSGGPVHHHLHGEIYNYKAVRGVLGREGVALRTQSDTEVLLEAYPRWTPKTGN